MTEIIAYKELYIPLTQGRIAIVDAEDYEWLNQRKWCFGKMGYPVKTVHLGYFHGKRKQSLIYMHKVIMQPPLGMEVDHINGNKLDNRKCNLRICTSSQNKHNQRPIRGGLSKYKGVTWCKGKWVAQTKENGKYVYLGRYECEDDAAMAYNLEATKRFGSFANINVIL